MSYNKTINNHLIKFEDEKSYLNCRLDYLNYRQACEDNYHGEDSANSLTFLGYIENEMYDMGKCIIESIEETSIIGIAYNGGYYTDQNTVVNSDFNNNVYVSGGLVGEGSNDYTFTEYGNNMVFFGDIQDKTNQKNLNSKNNKESIKSRFDILDL